MAVEWAVEPLRVIAVELPKKFQAWIDTMEIGTDDRPLSHLFGNGTERVLCFNYTEFPETLYHILLCHLSGYVEKSMRGKYTSKELGQEKGAKSMLDRIPQVFISYSWTSKEYQQLIVDLASRMRHDGVDVKLDVWDLKEGQDKYAYMEQCVTNPDIDKVLILSDRIYSEKADARKGGVGDETTIISAEVYGNADQHKFIPVVMERDEKGKEYLSTYLKSRIYRDLSGRNYEEEYETLLRTIFEQPSHRKPEIGERPGWLTEETPDGLYPLKVAVKKISAADLRRMKNVAARDFVDVYIESLKQFYVKNIDKDAYLASFAAMKEYRDVFLDHLKAFSNVDGFGARMADEFERLYNALFNANTFVPNTMGCGENEFDLFRLHVWELFICTVTYMLHFVEGAKRVMQGAPEKRLVKTVSLFLRMRSIISVIPAPKTCWTSWISYSRN